MKIVVFGPRKRTGVLRDGQIVDLNYAVAKFLREKQSELRPFEMAEAVVSSNLLFLIEGGQRALDTAQKALDYLFAEAQDRFGPSGERIVYIQPRIRLQSCTRRVRTTRVQRAPAATMPITPQQC